MSSIDCPMSARDQAIDILGHTHDGDDLAPRDLALIQTVVNHGLDALTSDGQEYWARLHQTAVAGVYVKPWLHGQEHLTKDHEGYVYWKGIHVEHYSFRGDWQAEAISATELAAVCREIERRNQIVSCPTVSRIYAEAHFGEGLVAPRFHVNWFFNEGVALLSVTPETSTSLDQAMINAKDAREQAKIRWGCDENGIRSAQINSRQDMQTCHETLRSDAQWARNVQHRTHVDPLIDQLYQQIDQSTLLDAATFSEHVLNTQSPASEVITATPNN